MSDLVPMEVNALVYVLNTGHNVTADQFDDDHEPIGPKLRARLVPRYMKPRESDGKLVLTEDGMVIAMEAKYGRR